MLGRRPGRLGTSEGGGAGGRRARIAGARSRRLRLLRQRSRGFRFVVGVNCVEVEEQVEQGHTTMSSPSNNSKWISFLAQDLLEVEEPQPFNAFQWCTSQSLPEQGDCR